VKSRPDPIVAHEWPLGANCRDRAGRAPFGDCSVLERLPPSDLTERGRVSHLVRPRLVVLESIESDGRCGR